MPNYSFGGIDFSTLKAVEDHAKAIYKRYAIGDFLDPDDFAFMLDLLNRHPEAQDKIGCGVMAIFMGKSNWGKTGKCFYLRRLDKSITDFSYTKCITRQGGDNRYKFNVACRNAVRYQVEPLRLRGHHVHHDGMQFARIVQDFIEEFQVNVNEVTFTGGDNVTETHFTDKLLENCWQDYHSQKATLVSMNDEDHKRIRVNRYAS